MADDDSSDPQFLCGACKQMRDRADVEMTDAPDPQHGAYPLCADNPNCTIERVARERDGTSQFKIDEPLE